MDDSLLLAEVESIRRRTQADLACGAWRWLLVWAGVAAGFVLTLAYPGWHGVSKWYWAVAVPLGLVVTVLVDTLNSEADRRVRRREWPYWATAGAITFLNTGGSVALPGPWMLIWLWVVLAGGFAVFLALEGEPQLSRMLWVLAGVFSFVGLIGIDPVAASMTLGAVFVGALTVAATVSRGRAA